ncbi:hypothetical protein E4T56_gene7173 [Termitomyces sp. T112]|nr:hypothetical protein E4T56_gene7173 [Termitomyces sp. T112]
MESEYIGMTHAMKEALWIQSLLKEVFGNLNNPTTLFGNNQSAIALAKDHQYHALTKHIDISHIYKLMQISLAELAHNSVIQSGFEMEIKCHWLGHQWYLPGSSGNDIHKTNVPDICPQ